MTRRDTSKTITNFKSTATLLRNLIDIASKGGNYLLNIGPMATGEVPPAEAERLREHFYFQFGRRGGNRTHNPRLRRPVLYPIELLAPLFTIVAGMLTRPFRIQYLANLKPRSELLTGERVVSFPLAPYGCRKSQKPILQRAQG